MITIGQREIDVGRREPLLMLMVVVIVMVRTDQSRRRGSWRRRGRARLGDVVTLAVTVLGVEEVHVRIIGIVEICGLSFLFFLSSRLRTVFAQRLIDEICVGGFI